MDRAGIPFFQAVKLPGGVSPQSARPSGKDFRTLPEENATAIEAGLWHGPVGGVVLGGWDARTDLDRG